MLFISSSKKLFFSFLFFGFLTQREHEVGSHHFNQFRGVPPSTALAVYGSVTAVTASHRPPPPPRPPPSPLLVRHSLPSPDTPSSPAAVHVIFFFAHGLFCSFYSIFFHSYVPLEAMGRGWGEGLLCGKPARVARALYEQQDGKWAAAVGARKGVQVGDGGGEERERGDGACSGGINGAGPGHSKLYRYPHSLTFPPSVTLFFFAWPLWSHSCLVHTPCEPHRNLLF